MRGIELGVSEAFNRSIAGFGASLKSPMNIARWFSNSGLFLIVVILFRTLLMSVSVCLFLLALGL